MRPHKGTVFLGLGFSSPAVPQPPPTPSQVYFLALQAGIPAQEGGAQEKLGQCDSQAVTCPGAPCQQCQGSVGLSMQAALVNSCGGAELCPLPELLRTPHPTPNFPGTWDFPHFSFGMSMVLSSVLNI